MDLLGILILSIIQGITEWLPVSSSAHLALSQYYFFGELPVIYDMGMHAGTMLAVLVYFRNRIRLMLRDLLKFDLQSKESKAAMLIVLGSVPTAIIGFAFKGFFVSMYTRPFFIGAALLITAIILLSTIFIKGRGSKEPDAKGALVMGFAQGLAVAPGISRSGATISAGLHTGLGWKEAASFSFLLAIPAIMGATLFLALEIPPDSIDMPIMLVGVIGSFISGYASIHILLNIVNKNSFPFFALYCAILGALVMFLNSGPCHF